MTSQPPERISFILLKSFAPGSLLFIPWGSYLRFHEDILWCLCCCKPVVPKVGGTAPLGRWSRNGRLGGDKRPS